MEEEIKACMKDILDKVCQKEYARKYYQKVKEKNKEIFRKRSEAWRKNNPEKYLEAQRKYDKSAKGKKRNIKSNKIYYEKNKEKAHEYYKQYRDSGKLKQYKELYRAQQRIHSKKYYQKVKEKNKEIFRKRSEAWRKNNPEKYSEAQIKYKNSAKRKAMRKAAKERLEASLLKYY